MVEEYGWQEHAQCTIYIGVGALQTNVVPKNEITMEVGN